MGSRTSSMLQDDEINLISEETGFSPAQIERLYSRFKSLDKSGICGSLSREDFLRVPELAINPLCDRIVHMFFVDCDADHDRINFRQFMKVLATFRSSAKPTRSRQASRQESIQNILTSLSQNKFRHSRHSSCDGFFNYYPVQHHTTNQHSIHYVASTTHLAQGQFPNAIISNGSANMTHKGASSWGGGTGIGGGGVGSFKKPYATTLVDPDEPANSRKQKLHFVFKIYDVDDDNRISFHDLKHILKLMVGTYIKETRLDELAEKILRQADKNHDGFIDFDEFCTAFLHKDIDESLRVKFSTQTNSDSNTNNNGTKGSSSIGSSSSSIKSSTTSSSSTTTITSPIISSNSNQSDKNNNDSGIGSGSSSSGSSYLRNSNNSHDYNIDNNNEFKKPFAVMTTTTTTRAMPIRENIFNKYRAR